jgi:hypothetical protein
VLCRVTTSWVGVCAPILRHADSRFVPTSRSTPLPDQPPLCYPGQVGVWMAGACRAGYHRVTPTRLVSGWHLVSEWHLGCLDGIMKDVFQWFKPID